MVASAAPPGTPPTTTPRRTFVPRDFDVADFAQIEPLYKGLLDRPVDTPEQLDRWLRDVSELSSAIDEYGSRRYIDKSCHTDDPAIEKAYRHFVENVEPKIKPLHFALQRKFMQSPARPALRVRGLGGETCGREDDNRPIRRHTFPRLEKLQEQDHGVLEASRRVGRSKTSAIALWRRIARNNIAQVFRTLRWIAKPHGTRGRRTASFLTAWCGGSTRIARTQSPGGFAGNAAAIITRAVTIVVDAHQ